MKPLSLICVCLLATGCTLTVEVGRPTAKRQASPMAAYQLSAKEIQINTNLMLTAEQLGVKPQWLVLAKQIQFITESMPEFKGPRRVPIMAPEIPMPPEPSPRK